MKRSIRILAGFIVTWILSFSTVLAAGIDHFNVTMTPDQINAWESLDLMIEAADKNDVTVKDYNGTILIFSESDGNAELPSALDQNTYTFMSSDQWVVKFENAVTFSAQGLQNIYIYDIDDDTIIGLGEVNVSKKVIIEDIAIDILSPENGLTIWDSNIKISGTTQKNHKIIVVLNDEQDSKLTTISNNNGDFEKEVINLKNGENTIIAHVLNADEEIVGSSNEINIKVESIAPTFKNVKVNPTSIETEWEYEVEVIASKELTNVSVIIDDVVHPLEEKAEGIYTASLYAPAKDGTFKIDVVLKDELGLETKELWAGSITVTAKEVVVIEEPIKEPTKDPIEPLNSAEPEVKDYSIKNLKVTVLKSKSVLTWNAIEDIEEYEVYKRLEGEKTELITTVTEPRFELEITGEEMEYDYFAVKAVAKTASGEIIPEVDMSEWTKVQTGPEMFILMLLSLLIWGIFVVKKQRA